MAATKSLLPRPRSLYHITYMSAPQKTISHRTLTNLSGIPLSKQKHLPSKDTTYPQNFLASSTHVGIKASNTKYPDLALLVSTTPCAAAAVFTQNKFQAAPVTVSREILQSRGSRGIRSVVINSGIANAVTGRKGVEDARSVVGEVGRLLAPLRSASAPSSSATAAASSAQSPNNTEPPSTLVMSTGIIGQPLPTSKILSTLPTAISTLSPEPTAFLSAASAICTTDTFPKLRSRTFTLPSYPDTTFRLAGMTKGAGMIHPNMATLLGLLWTDAPIGPQALDTALRSAVEKSFNSISIDGDTSTNDTLAVLANGAAVAPLAPQISSAESRDYNVFASELTELATELAQLIVRDGEGATKFVTINVQGAEDRSVGKRVASSIARSPLVKTALYGKDANWGRILCAIGYTEGLPEGAVVPEKTSVSFVREEEEELPLLVNGEPAIIDEKRAAKWLEDEDLEIRVRLDGEKKGQEVKFWTCDFSHEYVTINGDYRT